MNNIGTSVFSGADRSRVLWREIFRGTTVEKERALDKRKPVPGGSWGRSLVSTDNATRRLLQALRSSAPGGWSDDRYEQSRHFVGIVFAAIHRQNELLTQSEFEVFIKDRHNPDGRRKITPDDPPMGDRKVRPWDLVQLLERPNPDDDFGDLMAQWNIQLDLTGVALSWMVPNQLGTPFELYPIPTALAIPQPQVNPDYPDGYYRIQPMYPYGPFSSYPVPAAAVGAAIPAQWMLRMKYTHPLLRYDGWSPLTAMRSHIDQHEAMDRARWYSMKRGIHPSASLNFTEAEGSQPFPEEEIERMKADFENDYAGTENFAKLFICPPGASLDQFGQRPIDMDFQSGWEQVASFILGGGFGITKPAAGMTESASYANLFAGLKQLYWQTLDPKCDRIGRKLTRHVAPFFGDDLIVVVKCRRLDDHEVSIQRANAGLQAKSITKNEHRKYLDLPLTEEEWGNDIAGTPPPGEQQEQQGGMGGMMGGSAPSRASVPLVQEAGEEDSGIEILDAPGSISDDEPAEVRRSRESPGNLSQGALGPRKRLDARRFGSTAKRLSMYDMIRKALQNGSH